MPKYIDTPVGQFEVPNYIAERINKLSDVQLMQEYIDKCKNFVDPFLLDEMKNRKLIFAGERYTDVEKRLESAYSYIEKVEHEYLADKLYDLVKAEHDDYVDSVKRMEAAQIIDESYKLTILYDIVCSLNPETSEFTTEQLKAILSLENPLWELYDEWLSRDNVSHMDAITGSIKTTANERASEIEEQNFEIKDELEDELGL